MVATGLLRPHTLKKKVDCNDRSRGRRTGLLEINEASNECEMKRSGQTKDGPKNRGVVGG